MNDCKNSVEAWLKLVMHPRCVLRSCRHWSCGIMMGVLNSKRMLASSLGVDEKSIMNGAK